MAPKMSKASAAKEAKKKEKKLKAAGGGGGEGGAGTEELLLQIQALTTEKAREEELRSFMQLERDKLQGFWDITKARLEERTDELAAKDQDIESLQERHHLELKVYKQKVKHLLYEHQQHIVALKVDASEQLQQAADGASKKISELIVDKQNLQRDYNEQEVANGEVVRTMQLQHAKQMAKLRQEMQLTAQEMAERDRLRMHEFREEQAELYRQHAQTVEDRKSTHIQELQDQHSKESAELQAYYEGITTSNLDSIQQLRKELADITRKEASASHGLAQVTAENRGLHEPLAQAQRTVEDQRAALKDQEMERSIAEQNRGRLSIAQKQLKALQWEHEVLLQRHERLESRMQTECRQTDKMQTGRQGASSRQDAERQTASCPGLKEPFGLIRSEA